MGMEVLLHRFTTACFLPNTKTENISSAKRSPLFILSQIKQRKHEKKNYLCDHVHYMFCTVFWENLCGNKSPFIYLLIYVKGIIVDTLL
jgi:hypothetical protein